MTDAVCGYVKESDDEPCQRPAGWGTPSDIGHCKDHAEEYTVPRKMDEQTKQSLVGAARRGAFKKHCARVAGITPQTLRNWLNQGEEHIANCMETPLSEFYLRFERARAAGAVERLEDVDPEFVLERSYGYTKTETHELTGEDGGPIQTEDVTDEELALLEEAFDEEPET